MVTYCNQNHLNGGCFMNYLYYEKNCRNCKYFDLDLWHKFGKAISIRGTCSCKNMRRNGTNFECENWELAPNEKSPLVSIDERLKNIEDLLKD